MKKKTTRPIVIKPRTEKEITASYIRTKYNLDSFRQVKNVIYERIPIFRSVLNLAGIEDTALSENLVSTNILDKKRFLLSLQQLVPDEKALDNCELELQVGRAPSRYPPVSNRTTFEVVIIKKGTEPESDGEVIKRLKTQEIKEFKLKIFEKMIKNTKTF